MTELGFDIFYRIGGENYSLGQVELEDFKNGGVEGVPVTRLKNLDLGVLDLTLGLTNLTFSLKTRNERNSLIKLNAFG